MSAPTTIREAAIGLAAAGGVLVGEVEHAALRLAAAGFGAAFLSFVQAVGSIDWLGLAVRPAGFRHPGRWGWRARSCRHERAEKARVRAFACRHGLDRSWARRELRGENPAPETASAAYWMASAEIHENARGAVLAAYNAPGGPLSGFTGVSFNFGDGPSTPDEP